VLRNYGRRVAQDRRDHFDTDPAIQEIGSERRSEGMRVTSSAAARELSLELLAIKDRNSLRFWDRVSVDSAKDSLVSEPYGGAISVHPMNNEIVVLSHLRDDDEPTPRPPHHAFEYRLESLWWF